MNNLPLCSVAINIMVDPDGTLDALTSLALVSPTTPKPKTSNGASKPSSTNSPNRELPRTGLSRPQASGGSSAITNKWRTGPLRIEQTGPLIANSLWPDRPLPVHIVCTTSFQALQWNVHLSPSEVDESHTCWFGQWYTVQLHTHTASGEEEVKSHWSEAFNAGLLPHVWC